jgi:hypothetical protein
MLLKLWRALPQHLPKRQLQAEEKLTTDKGITSAIGVNQLLFWKHYDRVLVDLQTPRHPQTEHMQAGGSDL